MKIFKNLHSAFKEDGHKFLCRDEKDCLRYYSREGYRSSIFLIATRFKDGHAYAVVPSDLLFSSTPVYIDEKGKMRGDFSLAYPFNDGVGLIISNDKNNCYYFVDENLRRVSQDYFHANSFNEGFAVIQKEEKGKMFFIDKTFSESKDCFKYASDFHQGYSIVKDDSFKGVKFRDYNGRLSEESFVDAKRYGDGFAPVLQEDGKWRFRDLTGKISEDEYEKAEEYHDGFALVQKVDGKDYFFRDVNGQLIGPFAEAENFRSGFAVVKKQAEYYPRYLDMFGKLSENFKYAQFYNDAFGEVQNDNRIYKRDMTGRLSQHETLLGNEFYELVYGFCKVEDLSEEFFKDKEYCKMLFKLAEANKLTHTMQDVSHILNYIVSKQKKNEEKKENFTDREHEL